MNYWEFGVFGIMAIVLAWGHFSNSHEIEIIKNRIRRMENARAREVKEVHVHHHNKPVQSGRGTSALINNQTAMDA